MQPTTTAQEFPVARRGYERDAVDSYVINVMRQVAELRGEIGALRDAVAAAEAKAAASTDSQTAVERKLALAVDTAERIIAAAEQEAATIRARNAAEVEQLQAEHHQRRHTLDQERAELETRHAATLAELAENFDQAQHDLRTEREQREAALAEARRELDAEFAAKQAEFEQHRAERNAALAEQYTNLERELDNKKAAFAAELDRVAADHAANLEALDRDLDQQRRDRLADVEHDADTLARALAGQRVVQQERLNRYTDAVHTQRDRLRDALEALRSAVDILERDDHDTSELPAPTFADDPGTREAELPAVQ